MIRYTKKERCLPKVDTNGTEHWVEYIEVSDKKAAEEKLFQLEDIEDELGIDLITLTEALKSGIWYKDYKDSDCIKFTKDIEEHINWKELIVPAKYTHISLSFKDYGKTWSVDKKTLEK